VKVDDYINIIDEKLFALFQTKNDEKAFASLYSRYSKKILSYCIHASKDKDTAKDVFQKVWLNVVANKDKFVDGSFIAWIMIITRNQCLMEKRNEKITTTITDNVLVSDAEGFENSFKKDFIKNALAKLPDEFKEIIELKYYDDFSYEELAKALNISLSLVKVRLFRAKKMLSELLKNLKEYENGI